MYTYMYIYIYHDRFAVYSNKLNCWCVCIFIVQYIIYDFALSF